jgi:hypothetical protein
MKNNNLITTASGALSFTGLKSLDPFIDPYTRVSIGIITALGLSITNYQLSRSIGVGIGIASFLQLLDIKKGGRIIRNDSTSKFFVLGETSVVTELMPGQIPNNSIDGLTIKGLNGVFKVSDGIYIELERDNSINYSIGFGKLINQSLRGGGFKSKQWVDVQTDLIWKELYNKSI